MAKSSKFPDVNDLLARIQDLEKENGALKQIVEKGSDNTAAAGGFHYPLWMLIRDHLRAEDGSDSPRSIAEALVEAGHNLGRYPLRNVKITVTSPPMRPIFKVTKSGAGDELVFLVDKPIAYAPRNTAGVKAATARRTGKRISQRS